MSCALKLWHGHTVFWTVYIESIMLACRPRSWACRRFLLLRYILFGVKDGLVVCRWRGRDWYIGMVSTLQCHGNICSTVVVAGSSPILNINPLFSIIWVVGQHMIHFSANQGMVNIWPTSRYIHYLWNLFNAHIPQQYSIHRAWRYKVGIGFLAVVAKSTRKQRAECFLILP